MRLLSFNENTGQLSVQFADAAPMSIDVPIEDGAYLCGEALMSFLRGFTPTWHTERLAAIASGPIGIDDIKQLCEDTRPVADVVPSYSELRARAYPSPLDYLDAVVKGDQAAIDQYITRCLEVKALYPKPEPVAVDVLKARREM